MYNYAFKGVKNINITIKNAYMALTEPNNIRIHRGDLYIAGDSICSIDHKPEGFSADEFIDGTDKLVLPGLINCHTHAYMSLFRNCADDRSFEEWLFGHIMPMEDRLTGEDIYWGTLLSCIEMIRTGTTCYLDMHMFRHFSAQAASDIGIRAVLSRGLVGTGNDEGGNSRIQDTISDMEEYKGHPLLSFMLGPHAPYTCDPEYLKIVADKAKELGTGIHIHLCETEHEVQETIKKYGCTPIQLMERCGIFESRVIAAHCVYLTPEDIQLLKKYQVSVATNPVSNLKLANGIAPVTDLLNAGVNVCLGTDSSASNNSLNMVSEINTLALIHKGITKNPLALTARESFQAATVNGAKALGFTDIGRIAPGYKADLAIMDLNKPWFYPRNDLICALAYSATGAEFETVMINGRIVMRDGLITMLDEQKVYQKCMEIASYIKEDQSK